MGGIPQQRHPPEVPRRQWIPIHLGILVDDLGPPNERGHVEEVEGERGKRVENIFGPRGASPVLLGKRSVG